MATFVNASAKRTRRLSALAAASCLGLGVALAGAATPAAASTVIYDFVGSCSGCSGMGVGEIVLQNFTPGQQLTAANFVNFTFTTSFGTFSIDAAQLKSFGGLLDPTNLTGAWFKLGDGDGQTFQSTGTGFWEVMSSLNGSSIGGGGGGGGGGSFGGDGGGRQGRGADSNPPPPPPQFDSFDGDVTDNVSFAPDFVGGPNGGVPEPAAWSLMIGGFAGVGGILRSRKRRAPSIEIA